MILAFLAGILIGFSNMEDNFLTIPRALVYFPFYLAGTNFDRNTLTWWRTSPKVKKMVVWGLLAVAIFLTYIGMQRLAPMQVFYGRYNYLSMKQGMLEGVLWRILLYIIGFFMTFAFMVWMPEKQLPLSYIGTRTMAIYLFHGLTYTFLEQCTKLLNNRNTFIETILLLIFCAAVTWLFSFKPFTLFTNLFSSIHISTNKK